MRGRDRPSQGHQASTEVESRWHAIVLSWNGREDTKECLNALGKVTAPLQVICVDNGSSDGSVEAVRQLYAWVHLIENGRNLGFSGGCNAGIRWALDHGAEWVVLINNDAVVAPDAIDGFAEAAEVHPGAGVLAGKVYLADRPDRIWFAGQRFRAWLGYSGRHRGEGRRDAPRYSQTTPTDRATGALMAVSRATIDGVGLLDEDLFAYVEDVDWSLRARAAGFEVVFVPRARAWHRVGASTAATAHSSYYGTRNMVVVCERHRPLRAPLSWLRRVVILTTSAAYALRRPNRRAALRAVLEGYRDARAGRLGPREP
jgi:GT2 family glycosyltransferase